jgi:FkbM family methyltransferase
MSSKAKDIVKRLLNIENTDLALKHKLQIPLSESRRLRENNSDHHHSVLFGKKIVITDPFWHLHSLKEIFLDDSYKFKSVNKNPLILDCGANIGLSVIYFKQMYPGSRVIAFEPDPTIYKMLEQNLDTFGYGDVCLHNKAVWKENTILKFASTGSLGGSLDIHAGREYDPDTITEVPALRLKDYMEEETDFLKIDIEGAELEVLQDCAEELSHVKNIFVEYHSAPDKKQQLACLLQLLENAGFRVYIKEAWNNLPLPFLHFNYKPFWDLQLNIFGYRLS